jgi:hypothetical protein
VAALEPKIVEVQGSTRFYLDTKTLKPFAERFVASGYFTSDFPRAVERYYKKYEARFAAMSELDQMAKDGRGPLLETEDMDLFFCAQEYDYKKDFVDRLKLATVAVHGDKATAEVESTYQWKTKFRFRKVAGRWLIAGYCVYE